MQNGKGDKARPFSVSLKEFGTNYDNVFKKVKCKFCKSYIKKQTAYRHDGKWVGECCWDDRLKTTE